MRGNSGRTVADFSFTKDSYTEAVVSCFCYLDDMFGPEGGAEITVKIRMAVAWSKWRELACLLQSKSILLNYRGTVYGT